MKIKSMLSFIMAGLIMVSFNNFTVAAKETEKIYTLSELIEMDNEEFLHLFMTLCSLGEFDDECCCGGHCDCDDCDCDDCHCDDCDCK